MSTSGLIKRLVPFFLTFAAGLFIASFFVSIGMPRFGGFNRERRFREYQKMRFERDQARQELMEHRMHCRRSIDRETGKDVWMPVEDDFPPVPPPPPPRPARPLSRGN